VSIFLFLTSISLPFGDCELGGVKGGEFRSFLREFAG